MENIPNHLSKIDGQLGKLIILGFPFEELAVNASFEEMVFLFLHNHLPNKNELDNVTKKLLSHRYLDEKILDILKNAAENDIELIEGVRIGVSCLTMDMQSHRIDKEGINGALKIIASVPIITASYWRLLQGQSIIAPHLELGHAANYLYMLTGQEPSAEDVKTLEIYLNTVVEHGMNASTFAARVVMSTRSDFVSAVTAAIGAMKGVLHGGAPGPVLDMLLDMQKSGDVEGYLRHKFETRERLMGFGHRVYRVKDPRAILLSKVSADLWKRRADKEFWGLAVDVETTALRLLKEYKPNRSIETNVEYYTALVLHGLGLPSELFTSTFTVSRVVGWLAHCLEQLELDRIIRPSSDYTGPTEQTWCPIEER
ncbi:MAG: citrate/2-methylcitrate synthase [Crocosphaera sp.]|nr:citrate/2-methylcitrate synthase [Crocosphaera sp.]